VNGKTERYGFLDVAKAIGIYLVILGHMVIFNWKEFRFIFAFHMPLFLLLLDSYGAVGEKCRNGMILS